MVKEKTQALEKAIKDAKEACNIEKISRKSLQLTLAHCTVKVQIKTNKMKIRNTCFEEID